VRASLNGFPTLGAELARYGDFCTAFGALSVSQGITAVGTEFGATWHIIPTFGAFLVGLEPGAAL